MKSLGKNQIVVSSFSSPKLVNFFLTGAGVTVKNLNFLGLIFGKGKLVERKTFTKNFLFLTRKGHEKFGQTESCFPISSPKKLVNFCPVGQRVEYSNLDRSFIL